MDENHKSVETTPPRNVVVVRLAVEEIWNQGNFELADALFATTYVNVGGLVPDLLRGPEAIKLAASLHHTAFPRLHVTIERMVSEGATVAFQWLARADGTESPRDLTAEAPRQTLRGMTFCRLDSGKIVESWTNWDSSGVFRMLVGAAHLENGRGLVGRGGLN